MSGGHVQPHGADVRKLGGGVVNLQITAWASSICKTVGVCLRRFQSCTCHRVKRASDQHVCRSEVLGTYPAGYAFLHVPDALVGWR